MTQLTSSPLTMEITTGSLSLQSLSHANNLKDQPEETVPTIQYPRKKTETKLFHLIHNKNSKQLWLATLGSNKLVANT